MAWFYLLIGGLFEVGWAVGLKTTEGFTRLWPSVFTVAALIVSFVMFTKSMMMLEIGTAYAVFTGIGTAGTVIVGMAFMEEPVGGLRIFFVLLLIAGIVGLKLISKDEEVETNPADGRGGD
ncbi:multidrug efflux SMR transporter [Paenibacillus tarimensis]